MSIYQTLFVVIETHHPFCYMKYKKPHPLTTKNCKKKQTDTKNTQKNSGIG
jgi:hypothetical protein